MYYQEIYIFSDPETPRHALREKVFQALHIAFVNTEKALSNLDSIDSVRFGLSFPNYHAALNELDYTMRIFTSVATDLEALNLGSLKTIRDYIRLGALIEAPSQTAYNCFRRKQVKSGLERMARRKAANNKAPSYELALKELKEKGSQSSELPFIYVNTSSTGKHRIPIFIDKIDSDHEVEGAFTTYGLSKNGSTVPMF